MLKSLLLSPLLILSKPSRLHRFSMSTLEPLSSNPLLDKTYLPKFSNFDSSHVVPAIEADLASMTKDFQTLEQALKDNTRPSDYGVVESLELAQANISRSWGIVNHLMGVKNNKELRAVHEMMQPQVIGAMQAVGQSKVMFDAFQNAYDNREALHLEGPQCRILEDKLRDMKHSGVSLSPEDQVIFNGLKMEKEKLSSSFRNNLIDSTKAFTLKITNVEELAGLPSSTVSLLSQQAVRAGDEASTQEAGPWLITLDLPSYQPCMQHLKNRELREKLYKAYVTRASSLMAPVPQSSSESSEEVAGEKSHDNAPILERILVIRECMANMIGYPHYAAMSLASKMAGGGSSTASSDAGVNAVQEMTSALRDASFDFAKEELKTLNAFASKTDAAIGELKLWDVPFWSERLREHTYEYKEEDLKPYFALPNVLKGLFQLAERLFGISIVGKTTCSTPSSTLPDGCVDVWHEDVQFYDIFEKSTGAQLASFYLDPFSRPDNKNGGAWMNVCVGKSNVLKQPIPVAYLVCNGAPPIGEQPSLLTFREIETLFHEFGHGLQHMLTTVPYGDAAGISNVEWDAVELPSQFMENWCYNKATLFGFAKHYESGAEFPLEYYNKLVAAKNFNSGMMMLRQLNFGALDMALHSKSHSRVTSTDATNSTGNAKELLLVAMKNNGDDISKAIDSLALTETPFAVQQAFAKDYSVLHPLPSDRFLCSFAHIFAGGYAAGYYSYKWAEVMSADAFGAFEEIGLEEDAGKEAEIQAMGRKFRNTVLSLGGGTHPSDVFEQFRGRAPTVDALLRHSGLA